jgi:hypothetical protein
MKTTDQKPLLLNVPKRGVHHILGCFTGGSALGSGENREKQEPPVVSEEA